MSETQNNANKTKNKLTFNDKVFALIIQYKDTPAFKWVYNNPGLAMLIVGLWGVIIVAMFMWFVISLGVR